MSERRPSTIIEDILKCIDHIQSYTAGISLEKFSSHFMAVEACLYNIQVIGEAASHLPDDVKKENPGIPWTLIKGMRNRLIHEYFGTDLQLVWDVIKDELPGLKTDLQNLHTGLITRGR